MRLKTKPSCLFLISLVASLLVLCLTSKATIVPLSRAIKHHSSTTYKKPPHVKKNIYDLKGIVAAPNCSSVNWATWSNFKGSNATGTIVDASGNNINVTMSANYPFSSTPGIYGYYRFAGYANPIPDAEVPKTTWSVGAGGTTTMCFAKTVTNPVLLLSSLGASDGTQSRLDFSLPYIVLYDGGGMVYNSNTALTGTEGYAIIMFPGNFTCVTINSVTPENYTNLTWGLSPPPFPVNIADGVTTCNSHQLTASGGVSYLWTDGDTPTSATNTFHKGGTYIVTATDASGCTSSTSKTISLNNTPDPVITQSASDCSSVTLTASGGVSYVWNGGDTPNNATNTFHQDGTYQVIATNVNGCTTSSSKAVTLNAGVKPSITGSKTGCSSVTLTAGGGVTYSWDGGNTPNSAINTFTISGSYTVKVTNSTGCSASLTQQVTVNAPPIAVISGIATGCDNVVLTASGGISYLWTDGDTPTSATNTFHKSGTYIVTVTDANGCTSSTSKKITLNNTPDPVVIQSASDCSSVTLTASGGVSYVWNGGDTPNNATNTFHQDGTYQVIATNANGCTASASKIVTLNAGVTPTITGNKTGCSSVTLTAGGGVTYSWDGGNAPNSAINTFTTSGIYTVVVTNSIGCSASLSQQVIINAPPAAVISGIATACDKAVLTASGGVSYLWDGGETPTTATNTFTTSGTYTVIVTGADGCSSSASQDVGVNKSPVPVISGNTTGCGSVILTASGGTSYLWNGGNSQNSATNTFNLSGTYTVLVSGIAGCNTIASVNVVVNPPAIPSVSIASFPMGSVCSGTTVTFSAMAVNGGSSPVYEWLKNGTVTANGETYPVNNLANGDVITCRLTSDAICATPVTVTSNTITMTINPTPVISFDKNYIITGSSPVQLNPVITGDIQSYVWSPILGLSDPTIVNPMANPSVTTTYQLTAISSSGCPATADVVVNVQHDMAIPNSFTPNGDGANDFWDIAYLANYQYCNVKIFNRWGQVVFNSVGYGKSWDGTYNGKKLPAGTYYYVINLNDGKSKTIGGWVAILR